jgi:hypothetical protein
MSISQKSIVLSNARIVLNTEKTTHAGVNFSDSNAPYYLVKGKDATNPFAVTEITYVYKALSIKAGEQIEYDADPATALKQAQENGFILPAQMLSALANCAKANQPALVRYTATDVMYMIGEREVNVFSQCYPIGTTASVFVKEMTSRGVVALQTEVLVDTDDNAPFGA